jgi:outer membrane protein assembly factor BamB
VNYTWIAVGEPPVDSAWGGAAREAFGGVPTLGEGRLYLAMQNQVLAYDTTTACPHYRPGEQPRVCQSEWARSIGSVVTPVVIGDHSTVYVGSTGGSVYALRAGSGGIRWTANVGSVTRPPALAYDTLYVATDDGRMSALPAGGCEASECPVGWSTATGSANTVQPAVAGGVVYTGSADGTVKAFDASGCGAGTCPPLWTVNTGSPVTGGLAVHNGRLYVGTQGALVGYGLPPG